MKTIKIFLSLFIIICSLFSGTVLGQNYANSWINYNQQYFKFKIVEDGIYRITYGNLAAAGIPMSSINPENFQIMGRGQEVPIYISNQTAGAMAPGDYIEFYAQKNDGWYDSILYKESKDQVDNAYSLFNDTATYYLTWNTSFTNKRIVLETDNNYSNYTAAAYVNKTVHENYNNVYLNGMPLHETLDETISDPEYAEGEGFYGYPFYLGGSRTYNVSTKNAYTQAGAATVKFTVMGASNFRTLINDHHLRIQFAGLTIDSVFEGYKVLRYNKLISASALGNTSTSFTFSSINDLGSGADRNVVSFIEIKYPHSLDFEAANYFSFSVSDATQSKTYLNISNFNGGNNPLLYDLDNNKRIIVTKNGSNYQALIPNSGGEKRCLFVADSKVHNGVALESVGVNNKFVNYIAQHSNADYIIITHKSLMGIGQTKYTANDYAAYRNSTGHNSMLVDIDDLYEQFSYGINKNPMAIRNFINAAVHQLSSPPSNLFIIGKAYYPNVYRKDNVVYNQTLVPSFGSPPSDVLLTSYINDSTYKPAVPTGRLVAKNIDHIDIYLNKVMQYEDPNLNPPSEWKKKALFFSGGDNAGLQNSIASYLRIYEGIYEDTSFGGEVTTFYKTTTDPIQINLSAKIKDLIDNGVNMLNFFGHAAGIGFDISIDNPSEYNNLGKYPFLIANSCFAGDIYQSNNGIVNSSEAFVLIRDKGAIAYVGSVTTGVPSYLNLYTTEFFKNYCQKNYGKSLGSSLSNTVNNIYSTFPMIKEVSLEMTLHGDPAIVLNSYDKPDYAISQSSFYTTPEIVTTERDSFLIHLVVSNLGMAVNDSIVIEFTRTLPDLKTKELKSVYKRGAYYKDTIDVYFPIDKINDVGKNVFSINVDANSQVDELNESNNVITAVVDIKAADLKPVYPPEFAIVSKSSVELVASTFYPLSPAQNYIFELDTSYYFNSPLLESVKIISSGGVVKFIPSQTFMDSAVYYWRVSIDSSAVKGYNWRSSSFQYIPNKKGWSQADFFQFENNTYQFAEFNPGIRNYEFVNDIKIIKCINGIYPYISWNMPQYQINGIQKSYSLCGIASVKFAVINPRSGDPWVSYNLGNNFGPYDNIHCKGYPYAAFEFSVVDYPNNTAVIKDSIWFRRTADFIAKIPNGHLVLMRTARNTNITQWPEYLYKAYDSIGANFVRNIPDNRPYIIWGIKGDLGGATELIGDSMQAHITLVDSFNTKWTEGYIASPIIGPSSKWYELNWKVSSQESINTDSVRLALIGIEYDGTMDTVFRDIGPDSTSISKLNDLMPASDYPYCKLICFMKDDSFHTPAYIDYWQVIYKEAPEIAVAPKEKFIFHSDTLDRGDTMRLSIAYKNISDEDLTDSILVRYWVVDQYNNRHDLGLRRVNIIPAQTFIVDTFSLSTKDLLGPCSFILDINTINPQTQYFDQIEISHANNNLEIPFFVKEDNSNPILDVTFDGIHILDGDLVSARPEITISLFDDNKFIPLDDTSSFKVYLTKPGNLARKRIYFVKDGKEQLQFIPAELPKNKAKIIYQPQFDSDGEYILYVQAADAALNSSGMNDYQIKFEVINKSTITNLMNWPNPFTTKTHFVFTLTGAQQPDYMLIQIMTISGKVVKEIGTDELGNIHVGRNITDYAWDGTDDYGDRLANGVYLYRVITRINGEDVELKSSGADAYFKKNFGKMYLMR